MNPVRIVEKDFAIFAFLLEDISYVKLDEEIIIPKNTYILVDIEKNIALIGNDHVSIDSIEYKVVCC